MPSLEIGKILVEENMLSYHGVCSSTINSSNSFQFNYLFIYVMNSTANGQLQSQHKYE
jgi:hypothetical protein